MAVLRSTERLASVLYGNKEKIVGMLGTVALVGAAAGLRIDTEALSATIDMLQARAIQASVCMLTAATGSHLPAKGSQEEGKEK